MLPKLLYQIWFGACLVFALFLGWMGTNIVALLRACTFIDLKTSQHWCAIVARLSFSVAMRMNPQVKVVIDDESWELWKTIPRGACLCTNHPSLIDVFVFNGYVPLEYLKDVRCFYKGSLRHMPLLGKLFTRIGHFPVHYVGTAENDFRVDREAQELVAEAAHEHLSAGGSLVIAPEGGVNKNPRITRDFRLGAFKLIKKYKMPLYFMIMHGTDIAWPSTPSYTVAAFPATVVATVRQFSVTAPENNFDWESATEQSLASMLREEMQKEVDRLYEVAESEGKRS